MKAALSVIIPTYNRPLLVQQAIDSVLQQRGNFHFEIIVVDDGSAPETAYGLQRFGSAIRYIRQENTGLNPARNHGLQLATADYVALLDDDDIWLPHKTALLLRALHEFPQAGFVHSNFLIWKPGCDSRRPDGLRSWFPRAFAWEELYEQQAHIEFPDSATLGLDRSRYTVHSGDIYYWSLFAPMVLPSTAIIRRSALAAETKFPEIDSVGDWEFFARLSHRCGAVFVPHETTLNRSHEDAVRLTRVDPTLRLRRRIGLMQRLWRSDPEFMCSNASQVDQVEGECLRKLARLAIAGGDSRSARAALRELRRLGMPATLNDALLWSLSCMPFASKAVDLMRLVKYRAHAP